MNPWDDWYRSRRALYPSEAVVRFVLVNFGAAVDRSAVKLLDVGCGAGRHLWFAAREGYAASGIDGSEEAVAFVRKRLTSEGLSANVIHGDMTQLDRYFEPESFDAAFDVRSIEHNRMAGVRSAIAGVHRALKPGGKFLSILLAEGSLGDGTGDRVDEFGFENIPVGPAAGIGVTQFLSQGVARQLFDQFSAVQMDGASETMDDGKTRMLDWIIQATK